MERPRPALLHTLSPRSAHLPQAQALDAAAARMLPATLGQEDGATLGAVNASLTLQRIWHLLRTPTP